jgi:ATP-binding cassette subfamily B protein IrtB
MIRTILSLLTPASRKKLTGFLALATFGTLLRAASCVLLVPLVAALFGDHPATAWPWTAALVLTAVVGWVVDTITSRKGMDLGFDILDSGQRTVAERISRIRLGWFTAENTPIARQAIAATGHELVSIFTYLFAPVLGAMLLPVFIGLGLFAVSWQLALAALAGVPLLALAFWASARLSRTADRAAASANSVLTERIVEFARTQQALRAARRVEPERSHVGSALASQHTATTRLLLMQIPGELIFGLATQLALVLLAGTTVALAVAGHLSIPQAIALIVVIARYLEAFTSLSELGGGIEATTSMLGNVRSVLDAPVVVSRPDDASGQAASFGSGAGQRGRPRAGSVELRNVRFSHDAGTATHGSGPLLTDFSLRVEPGTTTAIVGPSGSGKSTILELIAGLRDPESGQVLVDGEPPREVGFVFQHPYLFDASIRDNVMVGRPEAPKEQVAQATALAHVDGIANRAAQGWDTQVGEAGRGLSGGERQRVSIARALLKPAPVLLVDEATSALDNENEAAVTAALEQDPLGRTKVIVAHRLSSIAAADRVIFLESGRIVEDGSVDELLAAGGRFADFWRQQDAAGGWRLA